MKIAKVVSLIGLSAMVFVLSYGFRQGDFIMEGNKLLTMPWGIVSLVDLYTGFTLFALWIFYREKSLPHAILWTAGLMALGFLAGSLYVFIALISSKGNWQKFWMGNRATP